MNNQTKILAGILVAIFVIAGISIFANSQPKSNLPTKQSQSLKPTNKDSTIAKPVITTSFYPVEFLVSSIVGSAGKVQSVTPKNISPHDYETTPQDIAKIEQSSLFVYMGFGIDGFADKVVNNLKAKNIQTLAINDNLPLQQGSEEEKSDKTSTQKSIDPHTWLSPKNMLIANQNLTQKLSELYPAQKATFEGNSANLQTKLTALDQKFVSSLASCKQDFIVTSHDAFGYLAKDYGFKIEAVAGTDPVDQISLQEFNRITEKVKTSGLKYIFAGDDESSKTIDNLAAKTDTKVLALSTMETIEPSQDYFSVMEANLQNLKTARECA
jgi:zinc transport system substrate-binding protein